MADFLKIADRFWPVLGPLMRAHGAAYQATNGRIGGHLPGVPALLLLDHIGAKSGIRRTTPLVYMPEGENFVLFAAKGGHPHHPAWLHNLRATPNTEIQIGSHRIGVHAREANPPERQRLWPTMAAYHSHWPHYQRRTERQIPIVILTPRQ